LYTSAGTTQWTIGSGRRQRSRVGNGERGTAVAAELGEGMQTRSEGTETTNLDGLD